MGFDGGAEGREGDPQPRDGVDKFTGRVHVSAFFFSQLLFARMHVTMHVCERFSIALSLALTFTHALSLSLVPARSLHNKKQPSRGCLIARLNSTNSNQVPETPLQFQALDAKPKRDWQLRPAVGSAKIEIVLQLFSMVEKRLDGDWSKVELTIRRKSQSKSFIETWTTTIRATGKKLSLYESHGRDIQIPFCAPSRPLSSSLDARPQRTNQFHGARFYYSA